MSPDDNAATLATPARPVARWRGLAAVIGCMASMAMFYGYTGPLLSIVLEQSGASGTLIGWNAAAQMAAVFVVLPFVPILVARFGPARVMLAAIGVSVTALVAMGIWVDVWLWFPLRFVMGGAQSLIWTTGEIWVNHASDDRARGRTVSIFMSGIAAGFAVGPFLQAEVGAEGLMPFLVAAGLMIFGVLPLFLSFATRFGAEGRPSVRLHQYVRLAPVPLLGNFSFSLVSSALMALLAVYGIRLAMDPGPAARLIGWMGLGGIVMPLLLAYLADKVDRRALLALIVALSALAAAGLPFMPAMGGAAWLFLMIFGGLRAAHYGLSVMILGERFRGADLASATAVFGFMFGIGSFLGPGLSGIAIDLWDPHGLPAIVALFYLLYLPLPILAWRRKKRGEPPLTLG